MIISLLQSFDRHLASNARPETVLDTPLLRHDTTDNQSINQIKFI